MIFKFLKVFTTTACAFGLVSIIANIKFTEVVCVAKSEPCNSQVMETINSISNLTLFTASSRFSEKLKANIFIKKYSFEYALPRKIIVHIVQKEPVYVVTDNASNQKFLIDNDGVMLAVADSSEILPMRVDNFSQKIGERVNAEHLFALEITSALTKSYELEESFLKSEFLEITTKDGVKALFPLNGDRDYLTGAFVLMYNQLNIKESGIRIDNNNINAIDLRFRDPVLTTRI